MISRNCRHASLSGILYNLETFSDKRPPLSSSALVYTSLEADKPIVLMSRHFNYCQFFGSSTQLLATIQVWSFPKLTLLLLIIVKNPYVPGGLHVYYKQTT